MWWGFVFVIWLCGILDRILSGMRGGLRVVVGGYIARWCMGWER